MKRSKLDEAEVSAAIAMLSGWSLRDGKLHRDFAFADFTHAFGFMAAAATVIQARDHHPEWSNVYGKVAIDLVTHDAGGITSLDVELARTLEGLAQKLLR
ncbi:MAG: 4a-hydroxytetrahydrobiopterin dehydratase [Polyangiales bacterium]